MVFIVNYYTMITLTRTNYDNLQYTYFVLYIEGTT